VYKSVAVGTIAESHENSSLIANSRQERQLLNSELKCRIMGWTVDNFFLEYRIIVRPRSYFGIGHIVYVVYYQLWKYEACTRSIHIFFICTGIRLLSVMTIYIFSQKSCRLCIFSSVLTKI